MNYIATSGIALCVWIKWGLRVLAFGSLAGTGLAADVTAERWRIAEIPLTSTVTYADPFQDVDVTATFTGPGGEVLVRPAFWDGGNTWRIRFAPTGTGQWSMVTSCSDPSNAGLHGVSRTVQCDAYTGPHAIYRHGFLKVSASGRYFAHADDTPFFFLGDTHWLFVHERFTTSNVPGVASQFKYTVDLRVSQGFTVFQSEAIHIPHGGTHTGNTEEAHCDLTDGLTAADLGGFANMDRKFAYISDQGLVHAHAGITWAGEPADNNAVYTEAYMTKLGRYWAARYGAFPVLWTVAQEIDPNLYGKYNATSIQLWYAAAQAITDNDAYAHPLGPHQESSINSPAESWWGSKPYHKWWPLQLQGGLSGYAPAKTFWQAVPTKPLVLYEPAYESFWTDTTGARGAGYKAFQWGMCGYGYGANGIWNDLYDVGDYGTAYEMPARYLHWYTGANLAGGAQMAHLKAFYTALHWWKLTPRFDDTAWSGFADLNTSFLSSDGNSTYVVYFFGSGNGTGVLKGMADESDYQASWFNPRTGAYTVIGTVRATAGQWTAPVRPSSEDWVLLVTSAGPVVCTIATPADGALVWPGTNLTIMAMAGSSSGTVTQVEFFRDGVNLGVATNEPYTCVWSNVPAGSYALTARATDSFGATGVSAAVSVQVAAMKTLAMANGSFETPGSQLANWAYVDAATWHPTPNSQYAQVNASADHFHFDAAADGNWCALIRNAGILTQDLATIVHAGETLAVSFYGGRSKDSSSSASGGVFVAAFTVGAATYGTNVDTTVLAQHTWQRYTLTQTITNSGPLGLTFTPVSGAPWLDKISDVTVRQDLTNVAILCSAAAITVPEGGTNAFQVRLSAQPTSSVVVAVAWGAGDANITVQSGASLTFTTNDWAANQTVTLAAAEDADAANGTATITCAGAGLASVNVIATETENDVMLTVTSGTGGSTTPSGETVVTQGATTAISATPAFGYSFVNWTVTSGVAAIGDTNAATTTVTISAPATVRANFAAEVTCAITAPRNGAVLQAGTNVTIVATASARGATVSRVEFFRDGVKQSDDTSDPYTCEWTNAAAGTYTWTARAIDSLSVTGEAAAVLVQVTTNGLGERVCATGGTVTNYTDAGGTNWTAHIFTNVGSSNLSCSVGGSVEVLVVGGGGGGGKSDNGNGSGGGGGAGGLIYTNLTLNAGSYTVLVGAGGVRGLTNGAGSAATAGSNSVFGNLTALGGGYGGSDSIAAGAAGSGGAGGGGNGRTNGVAGTGTQPASASGGLGRNGGTGGNLGSGAGGGGANAVGSNGGNNVSAGGAGGGGITNNISGISVGYAGGGGGGGDDGGVGGTASAGGGAGGTGANPPAAGTDATANTGGGGGGGGGFSAAGASRNGGNGGSGIVIVRYVTGGGLDPFEAWRQTSFTAEQLTNAAISSATADPDEDGLNNEQEYLAGTNPTNALSCLVVYAATNTPATSGKFVVSWQSVAGKMYKVMAATNLLTGFTDLATNIQATPTVNVYTDSVVSAETKFYRVTLE